MPAWTVILASRPAWNRTHYRGPVPAIAETREEAIQKAIAAAEVLYGHRDFDVLAVTTKKEKPA